MANIAAIQLVAVQARQDRHLLFRVAPARFEAVIDKPDLLSEGQIQRKYLFAFKSTGAEATMAQRQVCTLF